MIVAVTGGSGFIGRHIVSRHLDRGDHVRVLSRQKPQLPQYQGDGLIEWLQGDVAVEASLKSFTDGVEVLYHCAGEIANVNRMRRVNVQGTSNLLNKAKGNVSRWVQLSSAGVYGARGSAEITESSETKPLTEYERTKLEADKLVIEAARGGDFEYVILRPSTVFGNDMQSQALYKLIEAIYRKRFFYIGQRGAFANYIHVENVADALLRCGTHPGAASQTYNLSQTLTWEAVASRIAEALKLPCPELRVPTLPVLMASRLLSLFMHSPLSDSAISALTCRSCFSSQKIMLELGYRDKVSMEAGLRSMVDHWRKTTHPQIGLFGSSKC